jgi:hypothetical protein
MDQDPEVTPGLFQGDLALTDEVMLPCKTWQVTICDCGFLVTNRHNSVCSRMECKSAVLVLLARWMYNSARITGTPCIWYAGGHVVWRAAPASSI